MANVYGTSASETLAGGAAADSIYGGGGADTIFGGGGGDRIEALSDGNVIYGDLYATDPADRGDGGNDTILAGIGNEVHAGAGNDYVSSLGSSTLDGGSGNDTIIGNDPNSGSGGTNLVIGGSGNDLIRATGDIWTDDADDATARQGGDVVVISYRDRVASGVYTVQDFKAGAGGDVLALSNLFNDLSFNGFDGLNPLIDQFAFEADGTRVVQATADTLGGNSWLRLRQVGADVHLEADATGAANGSDYLTVVVLKNTTLASLSSANFDPPFSLDGSVVNASIAGGAGNDLIYALDGADTLTGGAGNDTLLSTYGNDSVDGGAGSDEIRGGAGNDTLVGNGGSYDGLLDRLYGDAGNDVLMAGAGGGPLQAEGGAGFDAITGGIADDTLSGGGERDTLLGGSGNDYLYGGDDWDTLDGGVGRDYLSGDAGDDRLYSGVSDVVFGAQRQDVTYTVNGSDTVGDYLSGGGDSDTLIGGAGADTLDGGSGQLTAFGNAGNDTIVAAGTGHWVDGGTGNDSIDVGGSSTIHGGEGDDFIAIRLQGNAVDTGAGSDTVYLRYGADWGSNNALSGFTPGAGGDQIDLTDLFPYLAQSAGFDYSNPFTTGWLRLTASGANTRLEIDLTGNANGGQWLTVLTVNNTSPAAFTDDNFVYNIAPAGDTTPRTLDGDALDNRIEGWDGGDTINGNGGNDRLDGGFGGADSLAGGEGSDSLFGFSGDDTLGGDGGNDFAFGGSGDDVINGGLGDDNAYGGVYKGAYYGYGLTGGAGNDTIDGGDGNDQLYGDDGNDSLLGSAGNDTLDGGAGDDVLRGGDGADYLSSSYSGGRDSLYGDAGNDNMTLYQSQAGLADGGADDDNITFYGTTVTVQGGGGNDTISTSFYSATSGSRIDGGDGNDSIAGIAYGGVGYEFTNNTVIGGLGDDLLALGGSGNTIDLGAGNDTLDFEYYSYGTGTVTTGTGVDVIELSLRGLEQGRAAAVITDFTAGAGGDKVDLTSVLGRLAELGYDYGNPFTGGWLRLLQSGSDTLLQVDLNGATGGASWSTLATLQNVTATQIDLSANLIPPLGSDSVYIEGTAGNDTISDTQGPGVLRAGLGNDTLLGLGGSDLLDGASGGADSLVGGEGNDSLFGFDDNDTLNGDAGNDFAFGGSGDDVINGGLGDDSTYGGIYKGTYYGYGLTGGAGNDTIDGGDGNDQLHGDAGNDSLLGGAGHDTLDGGEGTDVLRGGDGADNLAGNYGAVGDSLYGDAGNDYLSLQQSQGGLADGGADDDTLYFNGTAATVLGGSGNDTISTPFYTVTSGSLIDGGEGNDSISGVSYGGASYEFTNNTVIGGLGDDRVEIGGTGNTIDLGAGNDTLDFEYYGYGTGTVTTGAGVDVIELSLRGLEQGRAAVIVTDFTAGAGGDRIDLTNVLGRLAENGYDYSNPFTSGWARLLQSGADTLLQIDAAGAAGASGWVTLATLQGTTALAFTSANFVDDISPTGFALGLDKTGTEDADTVTGSDGSDTLQGLGGHDVIDGAFGGNDLGSGGDGNDRLFGFSGNDTLDGGLGNDFVHGGSGNDLISGGAGDDNAYGGIYKGTYYGYGLSGGTGNDTIDGGDGNDQISGDDGEDSLLGGTGNDTLDGGNGRDVLRGGDGADILSGGSQSASDSLYGDAGNDYLSLQQSQGGRADGGADDDTLYFHGTAATVLGGSGNDTISTPFYTVTSGSLIDGGEGNDSISGVSYGGASYEFTNNTVIGGLGDDRVEIGGTGNTIDLGAGNDTLDFEYYGYGTGTVTTGAGVDVIELSLRGLEQGRAAVIVTDFTAGAGGDRIDLTNVLGRLAENGYDYSNPFTSGWARLLQSGADTLLQVDQNGATGGGNWLTLATLQDTLATAFVSDNFAPSNLSPTDSLAPVTLTGGLAPDTLVGWDGGDVIAGNGDNDVLDGGFGGADSLVGGEGSDRLYGFSGNDTLDGGLDNDFVFGGSGNDVITGGAGDDNAYGGNYKGTYYGYGLTGGTGNDTIDGGDGNDQVYGDDGTDSLLGGAGNDTVDGGNGSDVLRGGDGVDYLSGGGQSAADSLYGDAGNDNLSLTNSQGGLADGGADDDSITFNGAAVTVLGGSGNDTISSQYYTRTTGSLIDGGDGNDSITGISYGGSGYDFTDNTLIGGLGDDLVATGGSRNTIDLGVGNDTVDFEYVNYGSGTVTTGAGLDVVLPSLRGLEAGLDPVVITDFTAGVGGDRIDLVDVISRLEQSGMAPGSDPFAQGYLRLTDNGTSTVLEADIDGATGGANFQTLVLFQGIASPASITAANFVQAVTPVVSGNPRAPTVQSKTVTLAEDASDVALGIPAPTDPDGGAVTITVASVSPYGAIRLADNTQVYGGQSLTAAQLTQLTFSPYTNYNGDLGSFRFTVLDNEGSSVVGEIRLQVTPVNDAPYINATQFSYSDDGLTRTDIDLDSYAYDVDGDALTYTVSLQGGEPLPGWLNYDPVTHVLSGIAPRNGGGTLVLEVSAQDPSGLSTGVQTITMLPSAVYRSGTEASELVEGLSGNDNLNGFGGNDTLVGHAGADTMYGGEGDDVYIVDNAGDYAYEAPVAGIDRVESSVTRTLGADFENLTLTGAAAIDGIGNALDNLMVGNGAANRLEGLEGNDTLVGGAGSDTLAGGLGNDVYRVGEGADQVEELAGEGTDAVEASVSHTLGAEVENLTLVGGEAIDGTGNSLANLITGNAGANRLAGGAGLDTLAGGQGDDVYVHDGADLIVEGVGEGVDEMQSGVSTTIVANVENLRLTGSASINGVGNTLANTFFANAGNNTLNGGGGKDTASFAQAGAAVTVSLAIAGAQATGGSGLDRLVSIENLVGSGFNDVLTGNSGANKLEGGAGGDTLTGGAGNDVYIIQGADTVVELAAGGVDEMQSLGHLVLAAEVENLRLLGEGHFNGTGNALNNILYASAGNNVLTGGDGLDTASYAQALSGVTVSLAVASAQATGGSGSDKLVTIENLAGSSFDDTLAGNDGNNRLDGVDGNDVLHGGGGNDTLLGSGGNDTMSGGLGDDVYVLQGADTVLENADEGIDEVQTGGSYGVAANVENVRITGTANVNISGNGLDNTMFANIGNNVLNGAGGVDTVSYVQAGAAVTVNLATAVAQATGGSGTDTLASIENLTGSAYDDVLLGNGGSNVLDGGSGNDSLTGGGGSDTLIGNAGNDTMLGGAGADIYVLQGADTVIENAGEGVDEIRANGSATLGDNVENLRLLGTGNTIGNGNGLNNNLVGNSGNNTLGGGAGKDTLSGAAGADTLTGGSAADTFVLDSVVGSDTITDFLTGIDKLRIDQGGIAVGNGDAVIDGATTIAGPGGFAASAELVVVTGNIGGAITTASAAAAIGSASGAYALGDTALFMVDNGGSSALYLFNALDTDAQVEAGELTLLATLGGTPGTTTGDILFGS